MNEIVANATAFGHGATQAAEGFPRHAWTLAEFEQLSRQGYFGGIDGPRKRVELIGGEIVPLASKGARHETVRTELSDRFARKIARSMRCHVGLGWRAGGDRYVEPDLMICPASPEPTTISPAEVVLLIEVADTSLSYDRTVKAAIYASLGVREYWSIDANALTTLVHLGPPDDGYRDVRTFGPGDLMTPSLAPDLAIALAGLGIEQG